MFPYNMSSEQWKALADAIKSWPNMAPSAPVDTPCEITCGHCHGTGKVKVELTKNVQPS